MGQHQGRHFLQIPGPSPVPDRVLRAMDSRSSTIAAPEFAELGRAVLEGCQTIFKTAGPVMIFPVLRHRRLGGGDRQHAVAGRQGADGRDRPFRHAVAADGRALGHRGRFHARRLAPRRRSGRRSRPSCAEDTATRIKAVMVVHNETSTGVDQPHRRDPHRDRPRRPSGAADGRYDLLAGLDRLPARRMGRRRHGELLAEGPDAAAGPRLQRDLGEGAAPPPRPTRCRAPTGTGRRC